MIRGRAARLDATRSRPYWGTWRESAARAFEAWVLERLEASGRPGPYLVETTRPGAWERHAKAGLAVDGAHPYRADCASA